ncbi:hypothetical protein BD414DRAFT_535368 [Trametes punicea]|nr:hypothetical protein BD414DRAFT_535368 [Trametes punicea]
MPRPELSPEAADESRRILRQQLAVLRSAIVHKPPFCQGTVPLTSDDFTLFYGKDANARRIDFADVSDAELQRLAETCEPATFGVDQTDVYDETYRKAGKLDRRDFSLNFSPHAAGLLDHVHTELGPQSFFKAHMDTPRSELMFGSLVLVFPTAHDGGALVLRERGKDNSREWTFDSAALLAQKGEPSVAYVAFFSDVEHEVLPIQSGYRVTVTRNLYYVQRNAAGTDAAQALATQPVPTNEQTFRSALKMLLDDPTFLPEGGTTTLQDVAARQKGSDAVVYKVVREMSLEASLRTVYESGDISEVHDVMCDHAVPLQDAQICAESLHEYLTRVAGGVVLIIHSRWAFGYDRTAVVHWVESTPWRFNSAKESFLIYGNEAALGHAYRRVSLYVRVGPAGARATVASATSTIDSVQAQE